MKEKIGLHIGKMICKKLEEKGRNKTWLARQMNYDQSSLCKALTNSGIHTDLLMRICVAMEYNFFEDIAFYFADNQRNKKSANS